MIKKVLSVIGKILEGLLIIYVIFITTCLLCRNQYNLTQFGEYVWISVTEKNQAILSDFEVGDLVVLENVTYNDVEVGDHLYYYIAKNEKYVLRSGIVASKIGDIDGASYTFEEAVPTPVAEDRVLGSYSGTSFSHVGKILDFLESQIGFLIFVILPIMVLFIYHVYSFIIMIKESKEQERELKRQIDESRKEQELPKKEESPIVSQNDEDEFL